jgi:GntR family carbon starvation induced transcriptional regulator
MAITPDPLRSRNENPKETLASTLTAQLRDAILFGQMAPGTRLRLEDLRAQYGVSLSPLREALARLSAEGLVLIEDQRGCRVMEVSESNCREVIKLRCAFESMALAESIRNGDSEWEVEVVAAYHRLSKVDGISVRKMNMPEWERVHSAYHQTLMSACGMPLLMQFCGSLSDRFDRYRRLFLTRHMFDEAVPGEHHAIFEAVLARDEKVALGILTQHIERTGANVLSYMQRADATARKASRKTPGKQ